MYGIFANPVCTEFSTARSTGKARNPEKGMEIVKECQRIIAEAGDVKFWVIENPATGRLKDFLGEPVMTYEPWHFGSPWTKRQLSGAILISLNANTLNGKTYLRYQNFILDQEDRNQDLLLTTKVISNLSKNFHASQ